MKTMTIIGLFMAGQAQAVPYLLPNRCAHDSLNQWTEGQPSANTAKGRNEWLQFCSPERYEMVFPTGDEKDPGAPERRAYPTFAKILGSSPDTHQPLFEATGYIAPTTVPATPASPECIVPAPNKFVGLCVSGCVTPETQVITPNGSKDMGDLQLQNAELVSVPAVTDAGTLDLQPMTVKRYIHDLIAVPQPTLVIKTVSGGSVQVSLNHPLLNGQHEMVKAEELKIGDSLVKSNGRLDSIVSIEKETYVGKLFNLTVDTEDKNKSLFIANGYVSGDKKFQDQEVSEFNRGILREVAFDILNQQK